MERIRYSVIIIAILLFAVSCGPVKSTMIMLDAEEKLSQAKDLDADQKVASVYYYWAAYEYLNKSKDEHGYSDFMASERFAQKSYELAVKAIEKAEKSQTRVFDPYAKPEEQKQVKKKTSAPKKQAPTLHRRNRAKRKTGEELFED